MRAVVVGAGVIGLSSAIRLLEAGHEVTVCAKDRTPYTTSDVAAAVYYPYLAEPKDRVLEWGRRSFEAFGRLAKDPATGVRELEMIEPFAAPAPDPWWGPMVGAWRRARPDELPKGYADGLVSRVPVIEMSLYMAWLERRVAHLGGTFEEADVSDLAAAGLESHVVVNCTGLGARRLAGDDDLHPVRGQVVRVRDPGIRRALLDQSSARGLTYVIPRGDGVVLGGTAEADEWDLAPDPRTERDIIERCVAVEPRLRGCEVVARAVGLRPARSRVRLEAERRGGVTVVHNYGHGGSGVTLSWGCADEAAALAARPP